MVKVKFNTNTFVEAFNFLKECIVNNSKTESDSCIAFKVDDEGVLMYTSNFMQSTSYLVTDNVEVSGEGTFLVSVASIVRTFYATKKESITFIDDGEHVIIQYGSLRHTLNYIKGSIIPPAKEEPNVLFKNNPFKFANKMLFSCGQDCGYVMSGIHLDFNEDTKYMTACCRTSVFAKEIEVEGDTDAKEFNIRPSVIKLLARFDGDIPAKLEGTKAIFTHGPITIHSSLIDGKYPKWRVAVAEGGSKVTIGRYSMTDACRSLIAGKDDIGIKLSFGPVCTAETKSKGVGGSSMELEVVGTTDCTMEVTLAPRFIEGFMNANPDIDASLEVFHDKVVMSAEGQKFVIAAMY